MLPHTVTSGTGPQDPTSAKLFDTSIIEAGATADIATGYVDAGNHPFYCSVHPAHEHNSELWTRLEAKNLITEN